MPSRKDSERKPTRTQQPSVMKLAVTRTILVSVILLVIVVALVSAIYLSGLVFPHTSTSSSTNFSSASQSTSRSTSTGLSSATATTTSISSSSFSASTATYTSGSSPCINETNIAGQSNLASNGSAKLNKEIGVGNTSLVSGFLFNPSSQCLAMTVRSSANGSYLHTSTFNVSGGELAGNTSALPEDKMILDPKDNLIFASDNNGFTSDGTVNVYNATSLDLMKQITVGINPSQPVFDPDNGLVYVGNYGFSNLPTTSLQSVQAISPTNLSVVQNISAGFFIHFLAYNTANHHLYAENDGSLCSFCTTSNTTVIDPNSSKVVTVLRNLFGQITYSPWNQKVYLLNYSESGPVQHLVILDSNDTVSSTITLSTVANVTFSNMALNPKNETILISNYTLTGSGKSPSSTISVFNTTSNKIDEVIALPAGSLPLDQVYANGYLFISADTTPLERFQPNGAVFVYALGG